MAKEPVEKKYNLYEYLPPDLQAEVDKLAAHVTQVREHFEIWAKNHPSEKMRRQVGLIEVEGQRRRIQDSVGAHFFSKVLVPRIMGFPRWCEDGKSEGYHLALGAIFNSGAFCLFYGKDPDTGETMVLLQERPETVPVMGENNEVVASEKRAMLGALGGYMKKREISSRAAIREALEELPRYRHQALFTVKESELVLLHEGRDYYSQRPPIQFCGYGYELSQAQMRHIKEALKDPAYIDACKQHSGGETVGIRLMPMEEALSLGKKHFRYAAQYHTLQEMASRLRGKPQDSVLGYTLGDAKAYLYTQHRFHGHNADTGPKGRTA